MLTITDMYFFINEENEIDNSTSATQRIATNYQ